MIQFCQKFGLYSFISKQEKLCCDLYTVYLIHGSVFIQFNGGQEGGWS